MTACPDGAPTSLIAAEIKALRKGRGIRGRDLQLRLGLHLRELVGDAAGDTADLRRALTIELSILAPRLPDDLRVAVMASLGLSAETKQMMRFGDRVSWLAAQSGRTDRTALRRIEAAEQLLAEEIAGELRHRRGRPVLAPNGWYLDELRTVLRLDTSTPESHERRRIVATRPDLTHVMAWLDVPKIPNQPRVGLDAEVLYGGRLVRRQNPAATRFEFVIELPVPLQPGDMHEYEIILRMPQGEPMRPHYIFTPEYQCNAFDLTVRFDLDNPPAWIRLVSGETVRMFDDAGPSGEQVSPDRAGEVHVRFGNPAMYLGYGLQWRL